MGPTGDNLAGIDQYPVSSVSSNRPTQEELRENKQRMKTDWRMDNRVLENPTGNPEGIPRSGKEHDKTKIDETGRSLEITQIVNYKSATRSTKWSSKNVHSDVSTLIGLKCLFLCSSNSLQFTEWLLWSFWDWLIWSPDDWESEHMVRRAYVVWLKVSSHPETEGKRR